MKRKLKIAGVGFVGVFVLAAAVGFVLPRKVRAERSILVTAKSDAIYPYIANFKNGWTQWSPFQYPNTPLEYSGPDTGVGARQAWNSKEAGGDGWLKIVKADPATGVEMEMGMMQDSYKVSANPEAPSRRRAASLASSRHRS